MASHLQKAIVITLILAIAIPISTAHRRRRGRRSDDDTEKYLRDICSGTDRSDDCWNILKSELHRFHGDSNGRGVVNAVIELAIAKSKEIRDKLDRWFSDSDNDELKEKYHSCSENYDDGERSLEKARRDLDDSDDCGRISDKINGAGEELEKCKRVFGSDSFDPAHVGDRNKELQLYLDIVRAAADRGVDEYKKYDDVDRD